MTLLPSTTETVHTPEGRFRRMGREDGAGKPLACGHRAKGKAPAWRRVRALRAEPALPETVCTPCLETYMINLSAT